MEITDNGSENDFDENDMAAVDEDDFPEDSNNFSSKNIFDPPATSSVTKMIKNKKRPSIQI